jgi:hypothetical protein
LFRRFGKLPDMAREEQNREDLLREATALVQRVELAIAGRPEPVVLGLRRNSAGSIYLTPDRVYHFNPQGELRRAFIDELLYKAERHRLIELTRRRTPEEVQLVRRELSPQETEQFTADFCQAVREIVDQIDSRQFQIVGQVPPNEDVTATAVDWLKRLIEQPLRIARAPNVDG